MKSNYRKAAGMTLMELMTVMAIVGILAAIAFPAYQTYVVKTNRAAARACLSEGAQFMERFYTTKLTYVGAVLAMDCANSLNTKYNFEINPNPPGQRTYRLRAVPIGAQLDRDTLCGTLTLNQAGARTPTTAACW